MAIEVQHHIVDLDGNARKEAHEVLVAPALGAGVLLRLARHRPPLLLAGIGLRHIAGIEVERNVLHELIRAALLDPQCPRHKVLLVQPHLVRHIADVIIRNARQLALLPLGLHFVERLGRRAPFNFRIVALLWFVAHTETPIVAQRRLQRARHMRAAVLIRRHLRRIRALWVHSAHAELRRIFFVRLGEHRRVVAEVAVALLRCAVRALVRIIVPRAVGL